MYIHIVGRSHIIIYYIYFHPTCIYIYIHEHTYIHIYAQLYTCILYICTSTHTYIYIYMYVHTYSILMHPLLYLHLHISLHMRYHVIRVATCSRAMIITQISGRCRLPRMELYLPHGIGMVTSRSLTI